MGRDLRSVLVFERSCRPNPVFAATVLHPLRSPTPTFSPPNGDLCDSAGLRVRTNSCVSGTPVASPAAPAWANRRLSMGRDLRSVLVFERSCRPNPVFAATVLHPLRSPTPTFSPPNGDLCDSAGLRVRTNWCVSGTPCACVSGTHCRAPPDANMRPCGIAFNSRQLKLAAAPRDYLFWSLRRTPRFSTKATYSPSDLLS